MATSKPLLPSDLRADPAPPPRAATRLRLSFPFVAVLIFTTVLFGVAVRNSWGCRTRLAYFICCYVLILASGISFKCTVHLPHGSAAARWAWRTYCISLAGLLAASLYQHYM